MEEKYTLTDREPIQRSRRTLLKVIGGAGVGIGAAGFASAQDGSQNDSSGNQRAILLGGRLSGWEGRLPDSIRDEKNPTLELQPGTRYKITWMNLDGVEHQLQILDTNDNVLEQTKNGKERGATRAVTFTATRKMKRYRCKYHPQSMRGEIQRRS